MDRKAALSTAAGLVLVVAGAASALNSVWTQPAASASASVSPTVVTEYVDQFGNPVAAPSRSQSGSVILARAPQDEVIVYDAPSPVISHDAAVPVAAPAPVVSHDDDSESEHESDGGDR